jgi:hypothetical protein
MNTKLLLNFEVESDFVESRSGVSAKGKEYEIHTQKVWVYLGSKFPKEMQLSLDKPEHAIKPGLYAADLLPALDVGDFGKLVVDVRKLRLFAPAAAAKAA